MIQLNPVLCEESNRIQLSLIHFGHATLGSWWKGSEQTLRCSQLYYIVKGSATIICNSNTTINMEAGNWYLLPTGTTVRYWCEDYMEEFYFHFKLCDIDQIDVLQNCSSPYILKISEDKAETFLNLISSQNPIDGIKLRKEVYSVLTDFIDTYNITFKKPKLSPCVAKSVLYIHNHLSMNVSVNEIAQNAYVSKSTLEKKFKEELQCSVHDYLLNTIMSEAAELLQKTKLSVGAISEKFGFCDQFYFSKRFKDKYEKSPKDFRNTLKTSLFS